MASEQIARIDGILLKCHEDISLCNELMEKFNIEKQKRSPGRPCIGDAPLTPAEKQRRYRERQHHKNITVTLSRDDVTTLSSLLTAAKFYGPRIGVELDAKSVQRLIDALDASCGGTTFK
ncbi:hypothetical protein GWG10_11405 [Aeromonas caviae]|uniref:hypothetical protein n=1 Tax=Aeromonas caviae TaxID=648 RepID=UPI0015DE5461|nr:hypothetical protein [Aeromonas caviae]QLL88761.1 hypothetical protein GWG10_11360 [Aeromonas caviae]QLL88770.1 hypothetical protein GWG10_11405 [Aeromonas caviae]